MTTTFRYAIPAFVLACASASAGDDVSARVVRPFIEDHCMDCHDATTARAGFRIDQLTDDFTAGNNAGQWKEVMDKINSGAMPPKKKKARPDAKEAFAVASWVAQKLDETTKAAQGAGGRVPMRRMNRVEYANTVRDLFSLDENFARRVEKELPADGKVGGFDRGASGLFMDDGQLDRYLAVADMVLNEAVFNDPPKVQTLTWDSAEVKYVHGINVAYKDASGQVLEDNPTPGFVSTLAEPLSMIPIDAFLDSKPKERRFVPHGVFPWTVKGDGIEYLSGGSNYRRPNLRHAFYAWDWGRKGVSTDGWYKLRIKAGAFAGRGKEAQKEVRLVVEYCFGSPLEVVKSAVIDAPLDAPKEYEFLMYLQAGPPGFNRQLNIGWDNGDKECVIVNPAYGPIQYKPGQIGQAIVRAKAEKKPAEEIEALKKQLDEAFAIALENRKTFEGPYWIYDPKLDIADRPRIWLGHAEWEGPLVEWPSEGRKALLFEGDDQEDQDGYLRDIFKKFLPQAYRRKVTPAELERMVAWTKKTMESRNLSLVQAAREGVKNVLCSPKFLYLGSEAMPSLAAATPAPGPQPLDGWELASRLSYFLWSAAPDEELYGLAAQDKLREPAVLRAQVKRMIADPKAWEFVRNFAGQWLSVRNFDNGNPPNRDVYKEYDDVLRDSSKREPLEFCHELLAHDLPITDFLESDFLMVNERLARHYGIEGVEGEEFRKVPAPADDRRGGVLGMSGILTYLADGTRTLPVRRATWVLDTLWNQPVPPPPPNAGDLPALKDKKPRTVRERLDEHRLSENCASCHARVDPFGMALENYDAIGMWRDRQNGEGMRGDKNSPPLDVSGRLPGDREFTTVQEYKAALLAEKDKFVKGFTEKLLCYALGRPIGYGDHLTVEEITAHAAKNDYRMQEIIQATVASSFFQTK